MSNVTLTLRAVLELIVSLQSRKAECEAAFDVFVEQRKTHTTSKPAISEGLKAHGRAMYAALDAGDTDTAEREGNEYMKWTKEDYQYDKMFQVFTERIEEAGANIDKINLELKKAFSDLASVTSHGRFSTDSYAGDRAVPTR